MGPWHHVSEKHQHAAATYVLPDDIARRIHADSGETTDAGPIFLGLRQWLRLRVFTDQPMGMPSLAVQGALGRLCRSPRAIDEFRAGACPHRSATEIGSQFGPDDADGIAMALTWALACNDQQLRADAPAHLPWLFAADDALAPGEGWRWTFACGHSRCQAEGHCVRHGLLPYLPDSLPHQIHFDGRPPHQLIDKSDDLFAPGYTGFPNI